MKGKIFFFVLCVCIAFISCSNVVKNGDDTHPNDSVLKFLDIKNAQNLYISTSNTGTRSAGDSATTQKLFKITEEGYVEEVKYLDENKKEITISQQPTVIQTVNEEYIFVGFGSSDSISTSYLVRKTDGAVFDMTKAGNPVKNSSDYKNAPMIKTDKKNNMYFFVFSTVVKVDLNGIDSLVATTIADSEDYVTYFDVDLNGNVIYRGYPRDCIWKSNGSIQNLESMSAFWIGPDGYIYLNKENPLNEYTIYKIIVDDSYNIEEIPYADFGGYNLYSRENTFRVEIKSRLLSISSYGEILELYNESVAPRAVRFDSWGIASITTVGATENYYYIAGVDSNGKNFLARIDPKDDSYVNLLPQGGYEVHSFTVSESDGIIFTALRPSDGKEVIGQIGIDGGEVTVLDEKSGIRITYLERIN